ncbi:MAG: ATP-binding cassette domain-containing protein [Gemmatimonadales bacterium]|nr:MAG: ATP-binding cassette domain-containing protein [Gemmatimonadales bacterium]
MLSLLPRFFIPQAGQVLIDDTDVAGVTLRSLRGQIGIVTQEAVIFHSTVADNIAYGTRGAGREAIVAVAKQAFVDDFVREMPEGYDTVVGERGSTLSGGQRQRIAIARAILRDPAILVFDEAMSQIDSESEAKIHQALQAFMAGRTTLLIAHRFSTVISADRVAVMVDGAIVDVGKHAELLGRCGVYRTLFETQLIGGQDAG